MTDLRNGIWVDRATAKVLELFHEGNRLQPIVLDLSAGRDGNADFAYRLASAQSPFVLVLEVPLPEMHPASVEQGRRLARIAEEFLGPRFIVSTLDTMSVALLETCKTWGEICPPKSNPFAVVNEVVAYFNESVVAERLNLKGKLLALEAVLEVCAVNRDPKARAQERERVFHGVRGPELLVQLQVADLCTALLLHACWSTEGAPLRVLWFENKPNDRLADVLHLPEPQHTEEPGAVDRDMTDTAGEADLQSMMSKVEAWLGGPEGDRAEIFLIESGFSGLHSHLLSSDSIAAPGGALQVKARRVSREGAELQMLDLADVHLFLIDIYLDETLTEYAGNGISRVDGVAIQEALERLYPGTPSAIVSSTEDYEEIRRIFKSRGEYFLPKKQLLSIPLLYYRSIEELGPVVTRIKEVGLRAHVIKLLRRWGRTPGYLWFGDKCYHMIDHSLPHVLDDWKLFNEIAAVLHENGWLELPLDGEEIYMMMLGVWLHDIGHKGNERYGEAHQIRDSHGILSAEFILHNPKLLDLREAASFRGIGPIYDTFYEGKIFPTKGRGWHLARLMLERHRKHSNGLSTLEKAALLALYHKSNAPVSRKGFIRMEAEGRHIPVEYSNPAGGDDGEVVCLSDILEAAYPGNRTKVDRFLQLTFLFRLVDGLDVSKERVGSPSVGEFKRKVLKQDLEHILSRLKQQADLIASRVAPGDRALALQVDQRLHREPTERIRNKSFKFDEREAAAIDGLIGPQTDYWQILNFAAFISVQDGHFDLHGCVDSLTIDSHGEGTNSKLHLKFSLNRPYSWLAKQEVGEMRRAPMSLWLKLFGSAAKLPYAVEEFKDGYEHLRDLLRLHRGVVIEVELPGSDELQHVQNVCRAVVQGDAGPIEDRPGWIRAWRVCKVEA